MARPLTITDLQDAYRVGHWIAAGGHWFTDGRTLRRLLNEHGYEATGAPVRVERARDPAYSCALVEAVDRDGDLDTLVQVAVLGTLLFGELGDGVDAADERAAA